MSFRRIRGPKDRIEVRQTAVSSKSVTHRALICAALAPGRSRLRRPLEAVDTRVTASALDAMGIPVSFSEELWEIEGCGPRFAGGAEIQLQESGTSFRFLTALAALGRRSSRLDGAPRLRERPLGGLGPALVSLGARLRLSENGGLPLESGGQGFPSRDPERPIEIEASRSSQFASALMLIGPSLVGGLRLELEPPVVSRPYLELTAQTMSDFGVETEWRSPTDVRIPEAGYTPRDLTIEADWSSASYPLAAAAVTGGRVRLEGLRADSRQADRRFLAILEQAGAEVRWDGDDVVVRGPAELRPLDLSLGDAPDIAPSVALLALFAPGASNLRNVAHLRIKESDRLELLAANLRRLGRHAIAHPDRLEIPALAEPDGLQRLAPADLETMGDHRMAMAFAVAGLRLPGIRVNRPECVEKSYPGFWEHFADFERGE